MTLTADQMQQVKDVFLSRYIEVNQKIPQVDFVLELGLGQAMLENITLYDLYEQYQPDQEHLDYVKERMHKGHKNFNAHKFTPEFVRERYGDAYGAVSVETAIESRLTDLWHGERMGALRKLREWYAHLLFATGLSENEATTVMEGSLPNLADTFPGYTEQLRETYSCCYDTLFTSDGRRFCDAYRETLRGGKPAGHRKTPEALALIEHVNAPTKQLQEAYGWKPAWPKFC